jgi:membrane-associated phospholipid phosphatase
VTRRWLTFLWLLNFWFIPSALLWGRILKIHEKLRRGIERVLFKGKSTKSSVYLTYAVGNVVLMLVLFYVLLNNIAYNWTGQLYPVGSGYNLDFLFGGLDAAIPFVPEMVVFYVYFFYPMVILTMLYFAFIEFKKGYALGWSLVFTNAIAILIYAVFPVSTFWWRQSFLANPIAGNFWASQVYSIWDSDTSFNCFPSLHAAVSTICFFTWYHYSKTKPSATTKFVAIASLIIAGGVILSTLFIKQHYIADEIAGIVLAWAVGKLAFNHLWKRQRNHIEPTTNSL